MIGKSIGPYRITSLLGKGGMGEVYAAEDTRLDRRVALKILPDLLRDDQDRMARFEREAKVLASLQHQNIASIYGLEELDGRPVLVMELAEGDDLSARIEAGSLTGGEIEKISRQLARGLEFAHEQGIVHRDLKPANIKVHGDGQVKILDFGLARALAGNRPDEKSGSAPEMPTAAQGLTIAGTVLGTAAYMSPEQARGYDVDRRSDIWAFGVILYEMLTGERLFEGETASDTMAAILRKEPEWEKLPADANPLLVQICRRCLEKDAKQRLRDIGEVRVALEGNTSTVIGMSDVGKLPPATGGPDSGRRGRRWPVVTGVLAVALLAVGYLGWSGTIGPQPPVPPRVQATVALPKGLQFDLNPAQPGPVTISPDGLHLAFSASDSAGRTLLYLRDLDDPKARALPGTEGAHYPFWSPDSRTVAFFSSNGLARADILGGPIFRICEASNAKGGSWNENGMILFAESHASSISMVSAEGGQAGRPDAS